MKASHLKDSLVMGLEHTQHLLLKMWTPILGDSLLESK